jgi:hypothetical protein
VAFDDQFLEVAGLGGFQPVQGQVVEDEEFDAVEFAHLLVVAGVEAGLLGGNYPINA